MFKIESYVTPIIMNHVDKYVKNIRPQDAQLSLWEGEALFQNLDLRLDVLENELNLPFELLSGHIHELNIRVPWTKITSEPIKVTINTIEFVLKLRDPNSDPSGSSGPSSPYNKRLRFGSDAQIRRSTVKPDEIPQQQQSAYSVVVNKIINNIVINCHNIILKYVEEEVVVSLNVQLLSFGSADEDWNMSMIDVNPVKVITRKLVTISDLTICLDKRNAAGQIDVCQEPMLYRCSFECRILRKYNVNTVATTSITRIGILTKSMDMNVSSMQFPLLMRLITILSSLKSDETLETTDSASSLAEEFEEINCQDTGSSYLSWAWNLLPAFSFEPFENEELQTAFEIPTGHTLEFGFYIEQLNFTLKNAEFIHDSILGTTKRIKYTPLVRFLFGGLFFERISSEEKNWSNFKSGISTICVEPLGPCRTDNSCRDTIIESSSFDVGRPFIDKSLFDASCVLAERGWGATNIDEYSTRITDDYLLFRGPLLAFDMVKYKLTKQNDDTPLAAAANRTHRVQYRILSSGVTFRYTESFQQVINIVKDFIDSYDYTAYYADRNVEMGKMHPPLMEDYDALMVHIPLQNYRFKFVDISIQVYPKLQPTDLKTKKRIANSQKYVVPHFLLYVELATGLLTTPLQPEILVHTTCQLPEKPEELLHACYNNFKFEVENFYLTLSNKSSSFNKLLTIPKMFIYYSSLIGADLWEEDEVPEYKLDVDCEEVIFEFSKRELVLMQRLSECVRRYDDYLLWKIIRQAWRPKTYEDTIKMQNQCGQIRTALLFYANYSVWGLTIKSLLSEVICTRNACQLPTYEILKTTSETNWLDFQAQFPRKPENVEYGANVIQLLVENFHFTFDPHLLDFLNYQEEFVHPLDKDTYFDTEHVPQAVQPSLIVVTPTLPSNLITTQLQPNQLTRRSSRNNLPTERNTRKISHPEETIHLSSDRDEKVDLETDSALQFNTEEQSYKYWLQFIKNLVLKLDIGQAIVTIFKIEENAHKSEMYYLEIKSPKTLIKSSNLDLLINSNIQEKIVIPQSLYIQKDTFNFSFSFTGLTVRSGTEYDLQDLFMPIHTNITLALTHKVEKYKATPTHSYNDLPEKVAAKAKSQSGSQQSKKGDNKPSTSPQSSQPEQKRPNSSFDDGGKAGILTSTSGSSNESNETAAKALKKGKMQEESFTKKKNLTIDVIIMNIHADTTPINIIISNEKFKLLKGPLSLITSVWHSMQIIAVDAEDDVPFEPLQVITAAEDSASIKDFFELESNSASSKVSDTAPPKYFSFAIFCQWTITKGILELIVVDQRKKHKVVVELEDLIFAVDKHSDFIKFTTKVGNFRFRYLEFIQKDWRRNESLRIKMLAEASSAPHFNFIYTIVTLKNYFKRIGAKQRRGDMNRSIAEIIISLQFTEIILDFDKLAKFLEPWQLVSNDYIDYSQRRRKLKREMNTNQFITAMMLPMVHVDSKGFILYLPVESGTPLCSTFIAKIESIKVTNYLENPLQRNPIRIDVWSKASSLGMLGMPGAYIEDRQYEITFNNISAATGNWNEIKMYMHEMANSLNRSNPAFEWNNPDRKTSLEFSNFFTDFKFVIIFAPCIEYNNVVICGQAVEYNCASDFVSTCTTAQINLLGCILANFWNISSVIDKLFVNEPPSENPARSVSDSIIKSFPKPLIPLRTTKSCNSVENLDPRGKKLPTIYYEANASSSTIFESIKEDSELVVNTDSGFISCEQNSYTSCLSFSRCKIHSNDNFSSLGSSSSLLQKHFEEKEPPVIEKRKHREAPIRNIPYNISLVAGICILKLFESKRPFDNQKEGPKEPLLSFTLTQPSFMVSQSIFELTTQIYLFNINVNIGGGDLFVPMSSTEKMEKTGNTEKELEEEEEVVNVTQVNLNLFPYSLVETKFGRVGPTGIKPPLFRLKSHVSKKLLKEVDVEFCKPITIILAEDCIERLSKCIALIYDACIDNSCFKVLTVKKVVRDTKIKLMRKKCFDADRIHFKLDEIQLKMSNQNDYNCKLMLINSKANIKFITRPEKVAVNILLGAFYIRTDNKIFLHPVNLRFAVEFVTEPWLRLPLVKSTAKFNVITLDIGVYSLRCLNKVFEGYKRVSRHVDTVLERLFNNHSHPNTEHEMLRESWLPIKCPTPINPETNKKQREEFYQDDLRAGAFQFVETNVDAFLPLPYQIQIIKKNYGIICWRYPQPRKMIKIHLFPVPMAVPSPTNIKCRMEYFSETHEQFLEYMEFCLSETVSKELTLPEREICANIWRVVIMQAVVSVNADCFDDLDDDDYRSIHTIKSEDAMKIIDEKKSDEIGEREFILHPKVLVGCMRIDTAFQSECVPRIKLLVTVNSIILSFLNQPDENVQLPSLIKKYKLAKTTEISQRFMVVSMDRIALSLVLNSLQKFTLTSDMTFYIKCLDYGFLNMVQLLDECRLQNYFSLNKKTNSLTNNMILSRISANFGPAILHTLLTAKNHWEDLLKINVFETHALVPNCIVVNRTHAFLSFGQTGTTERIPLNPKECYMYSFRSDYFNQELTFFMPSDSSHIVEASPPVPVTFRLENTTKLQYIRMGNKCLVIKSRKLSASQIYILVKGQVEIFSMVKYDFNLDFSADSTLYGEKRPCEYTIGKKSRATFFRSVQRNSSIAMRMKFLNAKGKLRSGDIPLKSNKYLPWLVKVPQHNKEFVSFWVRILREDITELADDDFKPQRLLITIWPVFEISSSLTVGITAEEATTKQQLVLDAEGDHKSLNVPATHLSEHNVMFFYDFPVSEDSKANFNLSLKNINWNKFFWYDEQKWTIEAALNELAKASRSKWPVLDENEWRIQRMSLLSAPPSIMFKCLPTREFGCALTLDVMPWGLFINSAGVGVSVCEPANPVDIHIEANCMEMMFAIKGVFTLKVQSGQNFYESLPIYFDGAVNKSVEKYYILQENVPIKVVIIGCLDITMLLLQMKFESGRRIFMLSSKYCITNFTKRKLCVMPFIMGQKETTTRSCIKYLDTQVKKKYVLPIQAVDNCIGISIDSLSDINFRKVERSSDAEFTCFVCIKICDDAEISLPILLDMQFSRRCFSIPNEGESIPLVTTLIEKNSILYLNIFEDQRPALLLNNQTKIKLFVAQTKAAEHTNVSKAPSEYAGKHFKWFQELPAFSKVYYTPLEMSENFPEVEPTICNLTIALYIDNFEKKGIKWSKAIRTDKTWEKYLNVPNYGDVRVVVCDQHKVTRVTIYYIAQKLEFSVKDLRLRLQSPSDIDLLKLPDAVDDEYDDDANSIESLTDPFIKEELTPTPKCIHFRENCGDKVQIKMRCIVKEFKLALKIDDKHQSYKKITIMELNVDDLFVAYNEDDDKRQMEVIISNLQIDNQLFSTGRYDFPVVLCSEELYAVNPLLPNIHALDVVYKELRTKIKPMAVFTITLYDDEFVIRSLVCSINPIRAYIEDSYLNHLLDALLECDPSNCVYQQHSEWERMVLTHDQILLPRDVAAQATYLSDAMKLESFRIQPLSVLLSVHTSVRLYIALDHSPLSFSAYEKNQIYTVPLRFGQSLGMHYLSGAIFGAGWVVGSLEILGSPSCLARSFSIGLRDFVSMPVQGLFRGPWGFVVGVTQGSASLLRNVTAGTVNSVTKLAASVARNLDRLTLDADHIERTEAIRRLRPQGFTQGFSQGMTALGINILGAVGGLARHTLEARSPVEVVTGVGKGLVGAFTKPLSGAVELVALTGQGMLHTVGFNAMPQQRSQADNFNFATEPSAFRIWKLLPGVLSTDQILFYQNVLLIVKDQLRNGYAFLTSAVFAIMESQWDKLTFVYPTDKVELYVDENDKTLIHVRKIKDGEEIDEHQVYVHQRIMNFLQTSTTNLNAHLTSDSLNDILLMGIQSDEKDYLAWSFHITEHMGEYLVEYLKIINNRKH